MTATKSMQFDGTFGSAKQIAAWIGDNDKVNVGPWDHFDAGDDKPGGLDLVASNESGPVFLSAKPNDWVVKAADGSFVLFSAEQYAVAFPA
jgi:hypothetical protein